MGFVKIGFIILAIIVIIIARRYQYLSAEEIIGLVAFAIISYGLLFLIGLKSHIKLLKKQMSSDDSRRVEDIESKTKEMLATQSLGSDNLPKDKVLIQEASNGSNYHQEQLGKIEYEKIRQIFLNPDVADVDEIVFKEVDYDGILNYLVKERSFSEDRIQSTLNRLKKALERKSQNLDQWF